MEPPTNLIQKFLESGWIIPLIGGGGMIARLLSADSTFTLKQQLKRIITASVASTITWFVLEQTDMSSLSKAVIYGVIGVISPEIISGLIRLANKFEKYPQRFFTKFH